MKRLFILTTLLLTLLSGLSLAEPQRAQAQTGTIDLISQISGPVNTVFVQDNYTYISIGSHLLILDTTNLTKPTKIGEITLLDVIQDIYVTGNYAYVAVEGSGLQIVNISNKTFPTLVSSYDTPGAAKGVYVMGDYAYIADNDKGLQIIDVKNPAIPSLTSNYDTPGSAQGIYVMGNYAYVADYNKGLQVINISNPTTPILVGNYAGGANKVYVMGNYAYVINTYLQIIDISNPTDPRLIGNYYTPGTAFDVYVIGNYAYVADWISGLQIINISNPTTPSRVGTFDTPGAAKDVYVVGNYAYVADSSEQLQIVDISNQTAPKLAGNYDMPKNVYSVYITDNYAYLADKGNGLRIININNPSAPSLVGTYDNVNTVYGVHVVGNYAYLADSYYNGLQIVDISNPAIPKFVGSYNTPGDALGIYVVGSYAYIADGAKGLQIIDISTPTSPSLIGSYDTLGEAHSVYVTGNTAYVADGTKGLQIINISNPANPSRIGFYDTPWNARSVYVTGNTVYVADSGSGLQIIDISNPATPSLVGSYDTGNAYGVYVTGNYAYVADYDNGLQVINISNPANPTLAGSYKTPRPAYGIHVVGNYAYVADLESGLLVLRFNEATPTPTSTATVLPTNTPTATTVPPTNTPTATPTATIPPTSTPTATKIPPTITPTATTIPPTNTPTTISPTNTPAPTLGDAYEIDNSCPEAKAITTDGLAQSHTFHAAGDEDWVKFEGQANVTYLIDAGVPEDSLADVVLVTYDKCNGNPTANDSFNPEIHLQFKAPSTGTYFMRLTNQESDLGGEKFSYQLAVRQLANQASPGAVVIVAGKLKANDPLQANIYQVTNQVYQLFTRHGYEAERIYYLANDLKLNPDNDSTTQDVDDLAQRATLQRAITEWAVDKVGPERAFTLYMMDHGAEDRFYLSGREQVVSPDEVNSWLNALEAAAPGVRVNVIIDACYSGSFIKGTQRLGKAGRVIIASTTDQTSAYASPLKGAIFSDMFLQGLGQKLSLYDSFMEGHRVAKVWHPEQVAWLDGNGNGIPNEAADFAVAQQRGFAYAGSLADDLYAPYIATATGPLKVENGQGTLTAQISDDVSGAKLDVWAVVYKPSYVPPQSEELVADMENLPTIKLNGPDSNQLYRGLYEGFNESGTYRLVIYAKDEDGLLSRPRELTVIVGGAKVYLPVVVK